MLLRPSHPSKANRSVVAALALLPAVLGVVAALASCDDGSHTYGARAFDATRGCLGPAQTLDVVSGDDPGSNCAIKCLVPRSGDAVIYVSRQCPPYPPFFDTSGVQPGCNEAVAAWERGDICLGDGGTSHPSPDAGNDAETGAADSGPDADDASDGASDDAGFDAAD